MLFQSMTDVHMHVIPDVDDGSMDLNESIAMLKMAVAEGVNTVFATPHSWGYGDFRNSFDILRMETERRSIPVRLYLGMEVEGYGVPQKTIIQHLRSGRFLTMNGTRFVLMEFSPYGGTTEEEALNRLKDTLDAGFIPVIAHAERYAFTTVENIRLAKELGCRIQVNAWSVEQTKNLTIQRRCRALLDLKLVDFMGTDGHRMTHRPPEAMSAIQYLSAHYDEQYVSEILFVNAERLLCSG